MSEKLIFEAYTRLTNKKCNYKYELSYSGKFKAFNASVTKNCKKLTFNLSKHWQNVNDEIKIGLIQELLIKVLKLKKRKTMNIDLYYNFLRNAHIIIPKTKTHPVLQESFDRMNIKFFDGFLEKTNLNLSNSLKTLGSYDYGSDTITITKHLLENKKLLDYVMYHEMLHKYHKFSSKNCNMIHHSKQFKQDEQKFPNKEEVEKELQAFIKSKKAKNFNN